MDVKEFRADFVEAVNGVIEQQFKGLALKPNKEEINFILERAFDVMITMFSIADKIKGGGK